MMIQDVGQIVLQTLIAIITMFLLTKLLGRRQLSELSLFGYISGISIGNIGAYIALERDDGFYYGIISLILWAAVTAFLEYLTIKSKALRKVIDGHRTLLVEDGVMSKEALKKEKLTIEELLEQLRDREVYRLDDVEVASMEANGEICVFLKPDSQPLTASTLGIKIERKREPIAFIIDGELNRELFKKTGIDEQWLIKRLQEKKVTYKDIFVAQYYDRESIFINLKNGSKMTIEAPITSNTTMTIQEFQTMLQKLMHFLNEQSEEKQTS